MKVMQCLTVCAGNATVPVSNCSEERSYSHPKTDMKFSEFVVYMKQLACTSTSTSTSSSASTGSDCEKDKPVLYLKDWHCQRHVSCSLCVLQLAAEFANKHFTFFSDFKKMTFYVFLTLAKV